jgi:hypothetical protein
LTSDSYSDDYTDLQLFAPLPESDLIKDTIIPVSSRVDALNIIKANNNIDESYAPMAGVELK